MSSEAVPHPQESRRKSSVRWIVLTLLVLASFIGYVLRTNMSVAGESMMAELSLSREQLGMILAAFAWGYAMFQFPGGVLGDVIGLRRAMALVAISWGVVNLLTGLVPSETFASPAVILVALISLRFLMGVVQAPLYPLTGATICNWFPESGWALPNGLTNTGLTLGSAATGPLIAWLMITVGWRQSFIVTAPLALVVAAVWWWYVRDTPGEHRAVSGVLNTGGNVVGGVVALVVPFIVTAAGWIPALIAASFFAFVAAGLWFFIRADRPLS